jgi:hypothetical protein
MRGRERKIERGVDREVNVGERGRCRRDSRREGERERGRRGRERERDYESVSRGERNTNRSRESV